MRAAGVPLIVLSVIVGSDRAAAQAAPFLFSSMPAAPRSVTAYGYYELGYGERTFEPVAGDGLEQAVGARAAIGSSVIVLARTGVSSLGGRTRVSPRGEVLLSRPAGKTVRLAAGVGYAREYSRTDVMLARFGAGRTTSRSMVAGNVVLEKPMSGSRDAMDVITSVGAGRRVGSATTVAVEAVGQDLEGFWDPQEKDGGARVMVGPSITVAPPAARWQLTLGGGPILRGSRSAFASSADRPLPVGNGYVLRSALGFAW